MALSSDPAARRQFLKFLAASPLLPFLDLPPQWATALVSSHAGLGPLQEAVSNVPTLAAAKDAINVMDFEVVARQKLPPAHFGYLATGVDDDATIQANRDGYSRIQLRVRRLTDVRTPDLTMRVLDATWTSPLFVCPVSSQKAFHPEGEVAVARAAKGHLQIMSTLSTTSIEDLNAARPGEPAWFQLYARDRWDDTLTMIKRAEAAGCPAVAWTIDLLGGSNRETVARARRVDTRQCSTCHEGGNPATDNRRRPMVAALARGPVPEDQRSRFNWEYIARLRNAVKMKVILKGIVTREDAELAVKYGADGVIVSNHGGRAEESLRPTIESLPDVVAGAAGKIPVLVDGGIRRGTDIFKALALGATATGIGRPYIWGLAAFGQEGVETVLAILRRELEIVMRQAGAPALGKISRSHIVMRDVSR
jgi:4-hydroxymandelate oxidase